MSTHYDEHLWFQVKKILAFNLSRNFSEQSVRYKHPTWNFDPHSIAPNRLTNKFSQNSIYLYNVERNNMSTIIHKFKIFY